MDEGVGDQLANRRVGVTRKRNPQQADLDLLLGIAGFDPVEYLDHRPQERYGTEFVGADFVSGQFLESGLVYGQPASDGLLPAEQQEGAHGQRAGRVEEIERPEQVGIRKGCENPVAAFSGEFTETGQLGRREVIEAGLPQREPGKVLRAQAGYPRQHFVRLHRQALRFALGVDGPPEVLAAAGGHNGGGDRHLDDQYIPAVDGGDFGRRLDRGPGPAQDQGLDLERVGAVVALRLQTDHPPIVVNADQQTPPAAVGQANDRLNEFGVVDLFLELHRLVLTADEERSEFGRIHTIQCSKSLHNSKCFA